MPRPKKHKPSGARRLPSGIQYRPNRPNPFRVQITVNGQRLSGAFPTLELAKAAMNAWRTDVLRNRLGFVQDDAPLLQDFIRHHIDHHIKTSDRINLERWQKKDRFRFEKLVTEFGHLRLTSIKPVVIDGYKKKELEAGRPHEAIRRDVACLKMLLNRAVHLGIMTENPLSLVRCSSRASEKRPEILTDDEIQAIFDQLKGERARYRPLMTLALSTGLRRNELLSLRWVDVDFFSRTLTVRPENAKSRKGRVIPLNQSALEALFSIRNNGSEWVFGHLPRVEGIRKVIDNVFRKAGIQKEGGGKFHLFRHRFASKLLEAGTDIKTVSRLLGHSTITVTELYLHSSQEQQRRAVERLAAVEKLTAMATG